MVVELGGFAKLEREREWCVNICVDAMNNVVCTVVCDFPDLICSSLNSVINFQF